MTTADTMARLLAEADDYEADTIEAVAHRAGILWDCQPNSDHPHLWTNREEDAACTHCGRQREEVT